MPKTMKEIVFEGYQAGDPVREIAERVGTKPTTVKTVAQKMGLKHPNFRNQMTRAIPEERKEAVRLGYARGTPIIEIAEQCGVTVDSIRALANRLSLRHPRRRMDEETETPIHSPQYTAWLRQKEGARRTLRDIQGAEHEGGR